MDALIIDKVSSGEKLRMIFKTPYVKLRGIITIFIIIFGLSARAQQDPLFTQYMFNKLLVNPAYAGAHEDLAIDLLSRIQWVGIDAAPRTISLAAHTLVGGSNVGLGLYVFRDDLGPTKNQGVMGTYSYRIRTQNGWFSFGIQGGIKYFDFDWNAIRALDPDYMFYPNDVKRITPDLNLGFYYQTSRYFAGISSKQLLENEYGVGKVDGNNTFTRLTRHYYGMAGVYIPFNDKIAFRPSVLTKFAMSTPVQVDLNASFLFSDIFWLGSSFRTEKAVTFLAGFKLNSFMNLGYSFDLYLNELQLHNKGSHEIRLGFNIESQNKRMKTPRYF